MRHTESAALKDGREGASADDAQQRQVGNATRCRDAALPLDHREVQGVLCQHSQQVSKERSMEYTFVVILSHRIVSKIKTYRTLKISPQLPIQHLACDISDFLSKSPNNLKTSFSRHT